MTNCIDLLFSVVPFVLFLRRTFLEHKGSNVPDEKDGENTGGLCSGPHIYLSKRRYKTINLVGRNGGSDKDCRRDDATSFSLKKD